MLGQGVLKLGQVFGECVSLLEGGELLIEQPVEFIELLQLRRKLLASLGILPSQGRFALLFNLDSLLLEVIPFGYNGCFRGCFRDCFRRDDCGLWRSTWRVALSPHCARHQADSDQTRDSPPEPDIFQ